MSLKQTVRINPQHKTQITVAHTAAYIGDLVLEMEKLAGRQGLMTLASALKAARLEAGRIAAED
ncbi:MAG: hypothetical protein AAGD92_03590 [Pseudomonadota bacterium]